MIDVGRFRNGDREYFNRLIRTVGPLVMEIAQRYCESQDDACDLFQETWRLIWEKRNSFKARGSFEAWVSRLTHNLCRDDFRSRSARQEALSRIHREGLGEDLGWNPPNPDMDLERALSRDTLLQAMDLLHPKERVAVTMKVLEEKTDEEVAEHMGIRVSTVRSHVRHGRNRLRKILQEGGK